MEIHAPKGDRTHENRKHRVARPVCRRILFVLRRLRWRLRQTSSGPVAFSRGNGDRRSDSPPRIGRFSTPPRRPTPSPGAATTYGPWKTISLRLVEVRAMSLSQPTSLHGHGRERHRKGVLMMRQTWTRIPRMRYRGARRGSDIPASPAERRGTHEVQANQTFPSSPAS